LNLQKITRPVAEYYGRKLSLHGAVPQGVDWNSRESQVLRFEQLLKIHDSKVGFSILDWGCGYGALLAYLRGKKIKCRYIGFDLSAKMIQKAHELHGKQSQARFKTGSPEGEKADYVVSSGIFNVRLRTPLRAWEAYVLGILRGMNRLSRKGFSFNCLTKYSDKGKMRPDLYYADPLFLFDHCKKKFSRNVALLHDYGLYEFTILVRKNP
jgi:SAM-dependent methyltransferase